MPSRPSIIVALGVALLVACGGEDSPADKGADATSAASDMSTSGDATGTAADSSQDAGSSFGRAMGYIKNAWLDVHGAGAQRSDPKDIATAQAGKGGYRTVKAHGGTALSHGPQGDAVRGLNFVRCVRSVNQVL